MINTSVGSFISNLHILELLEGSVRRPLMRNAMMALQPNDEWINIVRNITETLEAIKRLVAPLESYVLDDQIRSLETTLKYAGEYSQAKIASKIATIRETIKTELDHHFFYHYPRDRALLLRRVPEDWLAVYTAFPSAKSDILASVDCYALGQDRASIYHSMMILECGLPLLAHRLKIKHAKQRPTWQNIIGEIREAISTRREVLARPPKGTKPLTRAAAKREHEMLEGCGEAALEFKFFEHAWRNHIAHGREQYDASDAIKVLDHVRSFMEIISTKLKLKEKT